MTTHYIFPLYKVIAAVGLVASITLGYWLNRQLHVRPHEEALQQVTEIFFHSKQRLDEYDDLITLAQDMSKTPYIIANGAYQGSLDKLPLEHYPGLIGLKFLDSKASIDHRMAPACEEWGIVRRQPVKNSSSQPQYETLLISYLPLPILSGPLSTEKPGRVPCAGLLETTYDAEKLFAHVFDFAINKGIGVQVRAVGQEDKGALVFVSGTLDDTHLTNRTESLFKTAIYFSGKPFQVLLFPPRIAGFSEWSGTVVGVVGCIITLVLFRVFRFRHNKILQTLERELQNQAHSLIQKQRNEEFALIAHELAQPLTCVTLCLQRLTDGLSADDLPTDILARDLSAAYEYTKRASDFLEEIGRQIGVGDRRRQHVAVVELLHTLAALVEVDSRFHHINLTIHSSDPHLCVMVSRTGLEMVLLNLLRNSAEAIRDKGRQGAVMLQAKQNGDSVIIRVEDNGPGLSHPDDLFLLFKSTKPYGTGIGLAFCKRLITRFGGSINGGNRIDGGAWFEISLPACAPETHVKEHARSHKVTICSGRSKPGSL